jgi:hypothetical protein
MHHLKQTHYSQWLRDAVKDASAADEVAQIEKNANLEPSESRDQVLQAIRKRYTSPA